MQKNVFPLGNYLSCFSKHYFTKAHDTPWGPALNIDRAVPPQSNGDAGAAVAATARRHVSHVRSFLIENALYWLEQFHVCELFFYYYYYLFVATHSTPYCEVYSSNM